LKLENYPPNCDYPPDKGFCTWKVVGNVLLLFSGSQKFGAHVGGGRGRGKGEGGGYTISTTFDILFFLI
jgi:hypothetical protein